MGEVQQYEAVQVPCSGLERGGQQKVSSPVPKVTFALSEHERPAAQGEGERERGNAPCCSGSAGRSVA